MEVIVVERVNFNTIDVSNLSALVQLRIANNNFTSLDVSNNPALVRLECENNNLSYLNLKNGNNSNMPNGDFIATGNSSLTCIEVDNPTWSAANWTHIDNTTSFNLYCAYTAIPDSNFEAELEALGLDNISDDGQVPTGLIRGITELLVGEKGISNLTGIQDFVALERLQCHNNNIQTLDLRSNTLLEYIKCDDNNMDVLNLEGLQFFNELVGFGNDFTSFDFSNNPKLAKISLFNNKITDLDLSNNPELTFVRLDQNALTGLDIRNGVNTSITIFNTNSNSNLACIFVDDVDYSTANWMDINTTTKFTDADYCRYTTIPDAIFEARLEELGYDDISGDGQVPTALIEVVNSLTVNDLGIDELTGIEDFTALVTLNARGNNFTSLDVSQNTLLEHLYVNSNSLPSIDVSKNVVLRNLNIGSNGITSLDLSNNPDLRDLWVQGNSGLTSLDLSNNLELRELYTYSSGVSTLDLNINTELRILSAYRTSLASIDLSNNIELRSLRVDETNVTELDLSNNTKLETLRVNDTSIARLDLSNNTAFKTLYTHDTSLSYLNVKNGNNTNVGTFRAEDNPNLTCIIVDDIAYSTTNWTDIPSDLTFSSTYCRYTTIPDANFEAELYALGYDNVLGDGQVPTVFIEEVEDLSLVGKSIVDLTGIEDFTALKILNCASNTFTTLDLSSNTALTSVITKFTPIATLNVSNNANLETLVCSFNNLSSLDVSQNKALTYLECNNNNLSSLDVSLNTALLDLRCGDNSLTVLDVSKNTLLTSIWCQNNAITELDFSNQTDLVSVTVSDNSLTYLNVRNGNNSKVTNFVASNNTSLSCILVDDATYCTTNWLGKDDTTNFSDIYCRYTQIPDANFEAELETLGYDDISGDGQVPTVLIEGVATLALPNKGINDLTGIEDFVALTSLNCRLNGLTALDVTKNILLSTLTADGNAITTIDLSNNLDLQILNLTGSNLTLLDITNNVALRKLYVGSNGELTSLDISNNIELVEFRAYGTNIASLDLSVYPDLEVLESYNTPVSNIDLSLNPALIVLRLDNTGITTLDLSSNPNIESLRVNDTAIASLDLSTQTVLQTLYAHDTSLSFLNVKNGNNTNVTTFRVEDNPNLSCILVDNAAYSTTNWTDKDDTTSFSDIYCRYTQIPDTNFEARLEALGYDDISGDGQVPTALIEVVTTLDASNKSILDFTGIEDFVGLTSLNVGNNNATSIDVSNLVLLEYLRLDGMKLTAIDLTQNIALTELRAAFNFDIPSIDISKNILLDTLVLGNNSFTEIDLSQNTALEILRMSNNDLVTLDLSNNTALEEVDLSNNKLTFLNIKNGNNTKIYVLDFNIENNGSLSCVLVDNVGYSNSNWFFKDSTTSYSNTYCRYTAIPDANFEAALEALGYDNTSGDGQVPTALIEEIVTLDVSNQNIADLTGIEDFLALKNLDCSYNSIGYLDLSNNLNIEEIECQFNGMSSLDITGLTNLDTIAGYNNSFTSFDFSTHLQLKIVSLFENSIEELDLSNNSALTYLRIDNNNLKSLSVKNGNNTNINNSSFRISSNPNLTCIQVDDSTWSTTNWTNIDDTASFNDISCVVLVDISVFLQGAFTNPNLGEESLMRDDLRIHSGVYGLTSPYEDGAIISESLGTDDAGADSMVDWIWVELRDATNPTLVIEGKSGVLQRDGDIVATNDDRNTPLSFSASPGDYYIVVKHRNHLSIMTSAVINLVSNTIVTVDLTSSSAIAGGANAIVDMGNGRDAMIAGDFDENGQVQAVDISAVNQELGASGYRKADFDMNGQVQNSDVNTLLNPNLGKGEQLINSVD